MSEIIIQNATIENLSDIQYLNSLLFQKEYNEFDKTLICNWPFSSLGERYFRDKILDSNSCAFVASMGDGIVGYLVGGIGESCEYREQMTIAELENMFVLKECRGLGVGTLICKAFKDWCREKGVNRIRVTASAMNSKTIDFYKKQGFGNFSLTLESTLQ